MRGLVQDLRYALRQLRNARGFAFTAILSLALGIGATTAVFSVVWALLFDPFPYRDADRMVHLSVHDSAGQERSSLLTAAEWEIFRRSPVVEDIAISDDWRLTVTGHDFPEDIQGVYFSANAFQYFGTPVALGRGLVPADGPAGKDPLPVAVLGHDFWMRRFGGDPGVVGKTIEISRNPYTVVGVASPRFTWDGGDVYLPIGVPSDPHRRYYANVRLKPGVTHAAASAALQALLEQFAKETPGYFPANGFRVGVVGINEFFVKRQGATLYLLLGAVAVLLLVGCGNVSILLLARGTVRQSEFALRAAVGASRRRMVRQLLVESLALAVTGAALGVALAYAGLDKIVALLPNGSFPGEAVVKVNLPVLCFSVAVATATGLLFGLWPALQLSRPEVSQMMGSGSRKVAGSAGGRRTLGVLIGAQIALTLAMLTAAGAAIEGFAKMARVKLGYDPHHVMSVGIPVHEGTYNTWAERSAYYEQLRAKVAAVPGVTMAALSTNATPPANGQNTIFAILGRPSNEAQPVLINFVSKEYFPILRIPLAEGRVWDATESRNGAAVIVINRAFERLYFPKGDALGQSVKLPELKELLPYNPASPALNNWLRIVGVMEDKLDDGLDKPVKPEAFIPETMYMRMGTQILVRAEVSPLTLLNAIRKQVSEVNAEQQTQGDVLDLEHWITTQPEWQRGVLISWLFGLFAVLALTLAAVGLYSTVAYAVAQRTNEFGIRMALGAQRGHVLGIVFRSTFGSVVGGIVAGLALALVLDRVLAHWAEGSARDPLLLLGATILLGGVAAFAALIPARRASRIDPMVALRCE